MVDINTHAIIDMLESRDQDEVAVWLKSYPNICVVSRDGSVTDHNCITEAHPEAVQVSDRFHLYKNLTDYIIEYLKKHLNKTIEIVVESTSLEDSAISGISKDNENRKLTLEEKYQKILLLQTENKNQTEICRELNMDVRSYKGLVSASDEERKKVFSNVAATIHEEKVANKMKIVNQVRNLRRLGLSKSAISRETGLTTFTISRYLDENFNPVSTAYGVKRAGLLSVFYKNIDELLNEGIMASKIEEIIRMKGYNGSSSTIRHYVSEWKKRFKNDTNKVNIEDGKKKIKLQRNDIFKALFRPLSDIKNIEIDKFQYFCEQYPFFTTVLELVKSFKDIFEQHTPELLAGWLNKARNTEINELISFVHGIERDFDAVKNAVCLPYSNGLAEGCVNKIKVIKRVMYGRCSFETLKNKTIQLEKVHKFN